MFYDEREHLLESIKIMKGDVCAYGEKEVGELCDCKYRYKETKHTPLSELFSGCCELSNVYVLLSNMTDDEYKRILHKKSDDRVNNVFLSDTVKENLMLYYKGGN